MTRKRIRFDDLLGRVVRDADGRSVGRIYEVRAEEQGDDLVVVEYHLGTAALLERVGVSLLRVIGLDRTHLKKVAWDRLDISDPDHPTLVSGERR